jgi:hypothetical protein
MSRNDTARADAGLLQPLEITHQQRQQELEELADIMACVYGELTPEQRAKYLSDCALQVAA